MGISSGVDGILSRIANSIKDWCDNLMSFFARQWEKLSPTILFFCDWFYKRFLFIFECIKGWVVAATALVGGVVIALFEPFDFTGWFNEIIINLDTMGDFVFYILRVPLACETFLDFGQAYMVIWIWTKTVRVAWWGVKILMDVL